MSRRLDGGSQRPQVPARGTGDDELARIAPDIETLAQRLAAVDYLVDEGLATSLFLCLRLPQPLLLEGEAGGRKKGGAQPPALLLHTPPVPLQCYHGVGPGGAGFEW